MDKRLLAIICCPVSHKGLALAKPALLHKVNEAIGGGHIQNQSGETVQQALDEALVTDDGFRLYPVNDGIPVLLESESIPLAQLDSPAV